MLLSELIVKLNEKLSETGDAEIIVFDNGSDIPYNILEITSSATETEIRRYYLDVEFAYDLTPETV